jgi:2',3'-cyclic-nucleotide 2'-phosphodiesterase (5'-nucleotidase family)
MLVLFPALGKAQNEKAIQAAPRALPGKVEVASRVYDAAPAVQSATSQTSVDSTIPDDPALLKMLVPYRARVRTLDVVIGRLNGDLRKVGVGGGTLGNFVTDSLRAKASRLVRKPVLLTVINSGGLRKNTIAKGKLRVRDVFELLPFENALIQIDFTGAQVLKLLAAVMASRDAQSGARITYRVGQNNRPELVSARFVDATGRETAIDENATYTIVTIDYLYGLKSGRYSVLQEGTNLRPLGITLREAVLQYIKSQTVAGRSVGAKLDGRFVDLNPSPNSEAGPQ